MSDLTDLIDAFLAKYPDDADLTWRQPRRKTNALDVMVTDLVTAGERWRNLTPAQPHPPVTEAEGVAGT